ncbi:cytochrome P450 3A6-like [Diadema antillarum]|uniref:cytochrome P450 3A6-like n=1 Tax=Diadema antillarum TaxID=105358 RepID=UPI003A8ABBFF
MYATLGVIAACIILYFLYDKWCRTYFSRQGIPGPPSIPVFGNFTEWFVVFHDVFAGYFKKYGKVVGVYSFRKPILLVADVDIARKILVKDFDCFVNREQNRLNTGIIRSSLVAARDDRWRRTRNLLSPTFANIKLKKMVPLMRDCGEVLVSVFSEREAAGKPIECKDLYGGFAMDVVGSCAFGMRVNSLVNKDDPFITNAKKAFSFSITNPILLLSMLFPWLTPVINFFYKHGVFPEDVEKFFMGVFEKTIAERNADDTSENSDFLRLMLNAHKEKDDAGHATEVEDGISDLAQETGWKPAQKTALDMKEILGNSVGFFLAGFETTSTALGFLSYLLATNESVQDRLIAEVARMAPTLDDVTFEVITKMEYLNMVVMETLRFYPPGEIVERECNKDVTYNGMTIKKGQYIFIPTWNINHDPDLWPNPDTFDPERFSKERRANNHPSGWVPFGLGPRSCIGVRFAILEIKVAVVCILQKYRFEPGPETEIPPKLGNLGFLTPPNGINLRVRPIH